MKHTKLVLFGVFLFIAFPLFGQIGELRNNWSIGGSAGIGIAKTDLKANASNYSVRTPQKYLFGPTFGFTARYISEKYFAMICGAQIELNYAQRGWQDDVEDNSYSYQRTLNYLEIPFMAHLAFGRERGVRFFVNAGPQIGFLIGDKEEKSFTTPPSIAPQYGKAIDNKFDYGIVGGGGLEIRTKIGNFLAEGRYYFGLSDFFKTSAKDDFDRAANMVISARISYLIDLSK